MKTKFTAELDAVNEIIKVKAVFTEKGEPVYEVNLGFPMGTSEEEIRVEVGKHADLFVKEREQKEVQAEVDAKFDSANEVINNLNK